jgi:hypothetical protein
MPFQFFDKPTTAIASQSDKPQEPQPPQTAAVPELMRVGAYDSNLGDTQEFAPVSEKGLNTPAYHIGNTAVTHEAPKQN